MSVSRFEFSLFDGVDCPIEIRSSRTSVDLCFCTFLGCVSSGNPGCILVENASSYVSIVGVNVMGAVSLSVDHIFDISTYSGNSSLSIDRFSYSLCGREKRGHIFNVHCNSMIVHSNASSNIASNECGMFFFYDDFMNNAMFVQISDSLSTKYVVVSFYSKISTIDHLSIINCTSSNQEYFAVLHCPRRTYIENSNFIDNIGPYLISAGTELSISSCYCKGLNTIRGSSEVVGTKEKQNEVNIADCLKLHFSRPGKASIKCVLACLIIILNK